jgi:hypothetical protein
VTQTILPAAVASSGGINNVASGNDSATVTITNSTLSGNSASLGGGGIYNHFLGGNGSATVTIGDTVLNAGASGANIGIDTGTITSLGYNLSSDAAGGDGTTVAGGFLNATGDVRNTDPLLGPLQDNGGPTFTHELLTSSPAIDMGDPTFAPPPNYDQRGPGFDRVVNGRIEIGSFEVQAPLVCPQPQGYWKNNPNAWPVNSLTLGSQTYTRTELLRILRTAVGTGPRADASLILADQLIAAKLNIANGVNGTPVTAAIADADAVLSLYGGKLPYSVRPNSANGQRMLSDAATLESFNKRLPDTRVRPVNRGRVGRARTPVRADFVGPPSACRGLPALPFCVYTMSGALLRCAGGFARPQNVVSHNSAMGGRGQLVLHNN